MGDEHETAQQIARELEGLTKARPLELEISALDAFSLLACLQLAWRHPRLSPTQKGLIEGFGRRLQEAFATCPTVARIAEDGWDPGKDRR